MTTKIKNADDCVKKQTLVGAVIAALIIGFIVGAVYSSMKLGAPEGVRKSRPAGMPHTVTDDQDAPSVEIASEILKLEQYLKTHPEDTNAWVQLGNLFYDTDQYAGAIEAYEKALQINPGQINVLTDLGVMYRRNKQPHKAVECFDRAIALDTRFETARFNKGIVLLHDLQDIEGGIKTWEELVKINPMAAAPNGESVDAIIKRIKNRK